MQRKRLKVIEALENVEQIAPPKSVKAIETEIVLYARIDNVQGLEECDTKEDQIQLESSFSDGTRCRVRKTVNANGEETNTFTFKIKQKAEDGGQLVEASEENNAPVDAQFFDGFRVAAERELIKTRYVFNSKNVVMDVKDGAGEIIKVQIPNIQYEVDVFRGSPRDDGLWCKIDIEVDNILNFISTNYPTLKDISLRVKVTHLPFQPTQLLLGNSDDPAVRQKIDNLWESFVKPENPPAPPLPTDGEQTPDQPEETHAGVPEGEEPKAEEETPTPENQEDKEPPQDQQPEETSKTPTDTEE